MVLAVGVFVSVVAIKKPAALGACFSRFKNLFGKRKKVKDDGDQGQGRLRNEEKAASTPPPQVKVGIVL